MPADDDFTAEETTDPDVAEARGFYRVELWDKAGLRPIKMLHAGNRIDKARAIFDAAVKRRPGGRYFIRHGARVIDKWPDE